MVTVPETPTPVTSPVASTLPSAGLLLLHVPPVVASDNVIVRPLPTFVAPDIAGSVTSAFTVTIAVVIHVFAAVKVIVVVPGASPSTTPDPLTIAVLVELEVQETAVVISDRNVFAPTPQILRLPRIAVGTAFTVTLYV